jgi:predicted O-linked N-acetylglucosamine transferase (SPINDLY family)
MPDEESAQPIVGWFEREGIARERIAVHRRRDIASYLSLHRQVDLCLDTLPYSGGTTTAHALCMGVPTLTLAGGTPAGRQAAAILGHAGLEEFVAADTDDFVSKGRDWAGDLTKLSALRLGLRQRVERSLVRRPDAIVAGFEHALRIMWQRWCSGLPAESIDVSAPSASA